MHIDKYFIYINLQCTLSSVLLKEIIGQLFLKKFHRVYSLNANRDIIPYFNKLVLKVKSNCINTRIWRNYIVSISSRITMCRIFNLDISAYIGV